MNTPLNEILVHFSDEDRANHLKAVGDIAKLFEDRTTISVDPALISELSAIRTHVLSGGAIALDIEEAIATLKNEPSINAALIAAEVLAADFSKIAADTATMSRQQKMNYARANGLDKPRPDAVASMTANEHHAVLAGLSPNQRMNYARSHGLA
jgi:hypothetical protein